MVKRKMSRVCFKVDAVLDYDKKSVKCSVKDISLTGLFLLTDLNIDKGEQVSVTVKMESETTVGKIVLLCEAVRKEKDGIGLQFLEMPLDAYLFLRNLVAYNYGNFDVVDEEYCRHLAARKMKESGA
jgi:hypothetical protein